MILLDTHVLIWLAQEPGKISAKAHTAIREAKGGLAISDITMWEMALLAGRGRLNLTGTIEAFVEEICSDSYPADNATDRGAGDPVPAKLPKGPFRQANWRNGNF